MNSDIAYKKRHFATSLNMNSGIGENQCCFKSRVCNSVALEYHLRFTNPPNGKTVYGNQVRTINALPDTRSSGKMNSL